MIETIHIGEIAPTIVASYMADQICGSRRIRSFDGVTIDKTELQKLLADLLREYDRQS